MPHMRVRAGLLAMCLVGCGCGDDSGEDDGPSSDASTGGTSSTPSTTSPDDSSGGSNVTNSGSSDGGMSTGGDGSTSSMPGTDSGSDSSGGMVSNCDYEEVGGLIVMEAESLPVGEDWQVLTDETGYYADGYIGWTGTSHNNDPTHGVTTVTVYVGQPGRYRLRWRNRIGMGTNTPEHNDTWVKFPDAADYYGVQFDGEDERRVYPSPKCQDAAMMMAIEAMPQVLSVDCVAGSSVDDWFKVYSSGASDWSWSTFTNDNNGHQVVVEFDAAGDYTFQIAARGDWHLIDRIVIHEESVDDMAVQEPTAAETACR